MKRFLEILSAALLSGSAAVMGAEEPEAVVPTPPAAETETKDSGTVVPASPAASSASSEKPLAPPLKTGGVEVGDSTVKPGADGSSETLIQNGNRVIYQKNGASTFSSAPKGQTPQYVNDSEGRVRQVTPVQEAKPIPSRPDPVAPRSSGSQPSPRESRPSPIQRPERPSGSSMPRSPFLRPNPSRR